MKSTLMVWVWSLISIAWIVITLTVFAFYTLDGMKVTPGESIAVLLSGGLALVMMKPKKKGKSETES